MMLSLRNVFSCLFLFFIVSTSYAQSSYFLCGPDEDGCPEGDYEYCLCTPVDEKNAMQPYCLDFDRMDCFTAKSMPDCSSAWVFKNQSECIAALYQSEPEPACPIKTREFCEANHVPIKQTMR